MNTTHKKTAHSRRAGRRCSLLPRVVTSSYWLNLINLSISLSIACLGLNIVLGYAGQLSLAQAAFWGVGAYTTAILTTHFGLPVWAGMFAAFFVAAFFGVLLGIPTLKAVRPLSGHGDDRVRDHPPAHPGQRDLAHQRLRRDHQDPSPWIGSFELKAPADFFYVAAVALILFAWAAIQLKDSRVGRALHGHSGERDGRRDHGGGHDLLQDRGLLAFGGLRGLRGLAVRP